jgi:release factor glutamine methyltransferase
VIASNPPYVSPDADLAPEVRDHEPRLALFPPGALDSVYRRLIAQASPLLAPKGFVALELGVGLEAPVREICHEHHLTVTEVRHDLQGIPRTLVAHRL